MMDVMCRGVSQGRQLADSKAPALLVALVLRHTQAPDSCAALDLLACSRR